MTIRLDNHWTGTEPAAILSLMDRIVLDALTATMAPFQRGAAAAYAGTRFAGTFRVEPAPLVQAASLFSTDDLLMMVEEPTRPHGIDAKTGPYLHFKTARGWVKVAHVDHPGTKGKQAVAPLFAAAFAMLGERLSQAWEGLQRDLP